MDVVVCVIPDALHKKIAMEEHFEIDETLDSTVVVPGEMNFRRALKAKAMHLGKPLQLDPSCLAGDKQARAAGRCHQGMEFLYGALLQIGSNHSMEIASRQLTPVIVRRGHCLLS